jgi:hypothetical protein
MYLHFYFMSDPRLGDATGALAAEKAKHGDEVTLVQSASDLVAKVTQFIQLTRGRIKSMIISTHGSKSSFTLGNDSIGVAPDGTPTKGLHVLAALAPLFVPGAKVVISACNCGSDSGESGFLRKLTSLWPGVSVLAYTGEVSDWKWWIFNGFYSEGDTVVCNGNMCKVSKDLIRNPRWLVR